jgi:hypothetical protein
MDESEHDLFAFSREDTAEQPQSGDRAASPVALADHPQPQAAWTLGEGTGTRADGAWSFGKPARGPSLPKGRRPIALAMVVFLVAGVGAYFFLSRRSAAGGEAFALALSRNSTYSYDVNLGMNGTMTVQGQQMPFNMQLDQALSWRVESTDADGTAHVAVTVQTDSARFNGQPAPAIPTESMQIRVAKDGRILSAGGFEIGGFSSNSELGSLVPGSDQFMPLLPDHPVKVGESWTKRFDQELPFDMGRLRYDVDSTLLRYEVVDGKRTAVLFSRLSLPLDMTIDLRKVLEASGNSAGQLPDGINPRMKFGGSVTMRQTAWFDRARGELERSSVNANFDMSIDFEGLPQQANPPAGAMRFTGTMNVQVQRLNSAPKLSPKERKALRASQNRKAQTDLRNGLVAAKVHFTEHGTYAGFTPSEANRIESLLAFNAASKAKVGQVSIRVAARNAILLVTRSATGKVYCIAQREGRKIAYGTRDAKSVAACRGGW